MGARPIFYQKIRLTQSRTFGKVNLVRFKTAVSISIASVILLTSSALAVDSTSTATPLKPNLQQRVDTRIQKIDTRIATREANIKEKMQQLEQRKLAEASKAAMFRQKLEDQKLRIASHEAEVKAKIAAFKDKKKAEIATRVNTNLNKINQKQTGEMLKHLDNMSSILDKLTTRINSNSPNVKDPAAALSAVADARASIDAARTAVQTQAQKDYTITVTTETKIRLDAQTERDQLYKDIMATRKLVIDAKQSVTNAIKVARSESTIKEATPSGQQ